MRVRELMTPEVVTVRTDTPFQEIVRAMSGHGVSGLPVVTDGQVVGVVSEGDLLVKADRANRVRIHVPRQNLVDVDEECLRRLQGTVAGELMSAPAVTVDADADLRLAARLLSSHDISRLPVTSDGELVGILTRADVIRSFLRSDEDIREEIEREVLASRVLADTDAVEVDVLDGVVTLKGSVARASTARLIGVHVDRLHGVVRLNNELTHGVESQPVEGKVTAS